MPPIELRTEVRAVMLDPIPFNGADAPGALAGSVHRTGFVVLRDHPLPVDLVRAIVAEWSEFFASGTAWAYQNRPGEPGGFFPAPQWTGVGDDMVDHKEFFHVTDGGPYPREISSATGRYLGAAMTLATELLAWLDRALPTERRTEVPLDAMVGKTSGSTLRVQHYLPAPVDVDPGTVRARSHTDINLLTLLPAPAEPGLQMQQSDGAWHDVPVEPGALVVNGGEMLAAMSGGFYRAAHHRVINPTAETARRSRWSLPLFVHPADDIVVDDDETAAAFRRRRVAELQQLGNRPVPAASTEAM